MKSERHIKVGICLPSTGSWNSKFGMSLLSLVQKTMMWRPDKKEGIVNLQLATYSQETSMLVRNRHHLLVAALKDKCTHVLFLDSDMVFPADTLIRLLKAKKEIVAANCTTRIFPVNPIAHDLEGKVIDSRKKHGLQKVQHVGMAIMLIDLSIARKISPPWFMMEWVPELGDYCGEDIYFCMRAQEEGFDIWVDHTLAHNIGHVGGFTYGPGQQGHEVPSWKSKEG